MTWLTLAPSRFGDGDRLVGIGLERYGAAAAAALVGGDDIARAAILDAAGQRLGREAGEDHRVDRPDPGAGEHRIGDLGDHRHVDGHPVALADAVRFQHVGELADILVELAIGDRAVRRGRIVRLPEDGGLVAALVEMPVDAVGRDVEFAVLEPLDRDVRCVEGGVLDLGERLDPVEPLGLLGPEAFGVHHRAPVHLVVFCPVDKGAPGPLGRHRMHGLGHSFPPLRSRQRQVMAGAFPGLRISPAGAPDASPGKYARCRGGPSPRQQRILHDRPVAIHHNSRSRTRRDDVGNVRKVYRRSIEAIAQPGQEIVDALPAL